MAKEEVKKIDKSISILNKYLKDNKKYHYNHITPVYYRVSTGSLQMDIETGMLMPGVHRFVGIPESGKTSEALEVARNFLKMPNTKVLYVNAEGRLSETMKTRNGLKFTVDDAEWDFGTIFVLEQNVYEPAINLIRDLVRDNDTEIRYLFIIDSTDALLPQGDWDKSFDEKDKVAGSPLLTKRFLTKMSHSLAKLGHMCLLLSQHSAAIQIDQYSQEPNRPVGGGGGWGAQHFANFVFEFRPRFNKDKILQDPSLKPGRDNPDIGHNVLIDIRKSVNEKTGRVIEYPVKYNVVGKSSIWKSREVYNIMLMFGMLEKAGAWFNFEESLYKELEEKFGEFNNKIQGSDKVLQFLEDNESIVEFLYEKIRTGMLENNAD